MFNLVSCKRPSEPLLGINITQLAGFVEEKAHINYKIEYQNDGVVFPSDP